MTQATLIITKPTPLIDLKDLVYCYDELVKGVCDVTTGEIVMGGEWHSDAEQKLSDKGNISDNIWGFNIHFPIEDEKAFIVYQSMINIKPRLGYKKMILDDKEIIEVIVKIINENIIL